MGPCTSAELAAAVSNEGGLGGIGTLFRATAAVIRDIDAMRNLTGRPFAINHIPQTLDVEAFRYTLAARPTVILCPTSPLCRTSYSRASTSRPSTFRRRTG
jgi:enoyl-[acyl-carrier protein] reductase II